jgi:aerobic-type carbon monoxide dehydrogenase small subunit (CoxS/CutS family)
MADERDKDPTGDEKVNLGRRNFFKGVGIVGAGAAVADLLTLTSAPVAETVEAAAQVPGTIQVTLQVNGQKRTATVEPRTTLLNALRNHLEPAVTGPKLVCDQGSCGACTVLLDGKPVYSCLVLAADVGARRVTTAEGLGTPDKMNAVQASFVEHDGQMCGFCTPGFVTAISAYLDATPNPTPEGIREACKGNFCRCGTYPKVFEAALAAARGQRAGVTPAGESEA